MTERAILFNGAMVRAILSGSKTQTRRAIKLPHHNPLGQWEACTSGGHGARDRKGNLVPEEVCIWHTRTGDTLVCPLGQPGDRLWVRESFTDLRGTGIEHRPDPSGPLQRYAYSADTIPGSAGDDARKDFGIKWRPSIHMPREACRLVLEITDVRVERLQAISEADVKAEGIKPDQVRMINLFGCTGDERSDAYRRAAIRPFRELWNSTGGDWDSNPWVWAISFRRIEEPACS
jgi:hypothetical protein